MSEERIYCFRIRFHLPSSVRIGADAHEWILHKSDDGAVITLRASGEESIADSSILLLLGKAYSSPEVAEASGLRWKSVLQRAFAARYIGADFGDRAPYGTFTEHGLRWLRGKGERPVVNDAHGLMVYKCDPQPLFARMDPPSAILTKNDKDLLEAVQVALESISDLDPINSLAFDLFSASFFQRSADARFLMLMMAVETLLDQIPRTSGAQQHVESLIESTRQSGLSKEEIQSLVGSLRWLRDESIQSAGRRLAASLPETNAYMEKTPVAFFTKCYELRSKLVHGSFPRPSRDEVDVTAATLERFVGDLLARQEGPTPSGADT